MSTVFIGPYAGVNSLVTKSTHPGYMGVSDPSLLDPTSPQKRNPYYDADARKWDPRMTDRTLIPLTYKRRPNERAISDGDIHSQDRPAELYSREKLMNIFEVPKGPNHHHRQADYHEFLVGVERGYARGRDPEASINQRYMMIEKI